MGLAASKQEAFWEACGFGHKHRVRKFIDEGIDVNWVSYTHNSCAIHVASQGKKEIVQMLLDAGCDVNVKDDRGNLPMHHAAMRGHVDIMEMLMHGGSQLNVPDKVSQLCAFNFIDLLNYFLSSPLGLFPFFIVREGWQLR